MCTILVIDDEKGILAIIREALTRFGHHVETAGDGNEGLQKFKKGSFDMVITDMRMPGLRGDDIVRHIKNCSGKSVPVIGISGTPWLLEDPGFDMVLPKPFPLKVLVDSVEKLVKLPARSLASA